MLIERTGFWVAAAAAAVVLLAAVMVWQGGPGDIPIGVVN
jgi:hypothetical protein